jgi:hyperosmotically inducible protein
LRAVDKILEDNMNTPIKNLILASGLTLAVVQFSDMTQADTLSQDMTEFSQSVQISTAYALSPFLRIHGLHVSVEGDKATLIGKVEGEVNKELAKQIALGVTGINEVDSQITLDYDNTAKDALTGRSFGEMVDDATITATVKSKLLWSKFAEGLKIDVDTDSGMVTLKGNADSDVNKELAGSLAMNTKGVVALDNQLKINIDKPSVIDKTIKTMNTAGQSISDSWITTKVKSTLMYSGNVNGSQISVTSNKGVVSLSGVVSSDAERALAIKISENVRGVQSVSAKDLKSGYLQIAMPL